jgi:hypothetical protein
VVWVSTQVVAGKLEIAAIPLISLIQTSFVAVGPGAAGALGTAPTAAINAASAVGTSARIWAQNDFIRLSTAMF